MKVAIAVIINKGRVLIAQRPQGVSHAGYWEFPGGKVEEGETSISALQREVKEEVDLEICDAELLVTINYTYGYDISNTFDAANVSSSCYFRKAKAVDNNVQNNQTITLFVYCIRRFQGIPICRENQPDLRWVSIAELVNYKFPEANGAIITLLLSKSNRLTVN